jgi:hypothetical protein
LSALSLVVLATPAFAQTWVNQNWTPDEQAAASSITARLNSETVFSVRPEAPFGPTIELADVYTPTPMRNPFAAVTTHDVWIEGDGYADRFRLRARGELRRADGAPLPISPRAGSPTASTSGRPMPRW